jgi:gamma-glutamylcyclotransferase (GGCT)/AIG2-like uncharacterized protein YtfP
VTGGSSAAIIGAMSSRLFVYGSLMDAAVLARVLGHPHQGERPRARLRGYERVMVEGWDYPLLRAAPQALTEGVVLDDLSEADLEALDAYEDVQGGDYTRKGVEIEVWVRGPRPVRLVADTYVAGPRFASAIAAVRGL